MKPVNARTVTLVVEAESGAVDNDFPPDNWFGQKSLPTASAGQLISADPTTSFGALNCARLRYRVRVPRDGIYTLSVRAAWPIDAPVGVLAAVDRQIGWYDLRDGTPDALHWVSFPRSLPLKRGQYLTLNLVPCGPGVVIDQVKLQPILRYNSGIRRTCIRP